MTRKIRLTFQEGSSSKFWELAQDGATLTKLWGRIGTDGQEKVKEYASEAAATKDYDKDVAGKLKEGYVAATGGAPPKTAKAPVAPAPVAVASAATTIVMDPKLEETRLPTRGSKRALWPTRTREEAEASLLEVFKEEVRSIEPGLSKAKGECKKLQSSILHWLKMKKVPPKLDPDEQAAALVLVASSSFPSYFRDVLTFWLDTAGPEFALETLALTSKYECVLEDASILKERAPGGEVKLEWQLDWAPLRSFLIACDDATYGRARAVAARLREGAPLTFRTRIAMCFPLETEWVQEALTAWTTAVVDPKFKEFASVGPGDLLKGATLALAPQVMALFKALMEAKRNYALCQLKEHFNEFVALAGSAAVEPILYIANVLVESNEDPGDEFVKVLSQIRGAKTAEFFARQAGDRNWRTMEYFRSAPELSAALGAVAAGKGKSAAAAKAVLAKLQSVVKSQKSTPQSSIPSGKPTADLVERFLKELAAAVQDDAAQLKWRPANEFPESVENFGLECKVDIMLERNEQVGIVAWKQKAKTELDDCPMFQLTDDGQCSLSAGSGRDLVELITTTGDIDCDFSSAAKARQSMNGARDEMPAGKRVLLDGLRKRLGLGDPDIAALAEALVKGKKKFGSVNLFEAPAED